MGRLKLCSVTAFVALIGALHTPSAIAADQAVAAINRGVVELETSGAAGISVRIAEDLAKLIDDGATRRVVPVVGKGSLQNLADLKYLRGIDLAILQVDVLDYAKEQRLFPGFYASLSYIAKLYNEEFHLLAGPDIKSVGDLANKKVNVDLRGSGTAITANRLFTSLKIPVTVTNDSQEVALDKLRRGEIAALAFVAGKPAPLFMGLKGDDGLHFLAVPFNQAANSAYSPTRLTATDYPGLVPQGRAVDTVAVGSVLAVADLRQLTERYNNVVNFIDVFFTGFQTLDRKSTRLNSSHVEISYAVFCLKNKKKTGGYIGFMEPHSGTIPEVVRRFWYTHDLFLLDNEAALDARSLENHFFFNVTATTEIYTLSLHDALPILGAGRDRWHRRMDGRHRWRCRHGGRLL